MGRSGNRANLVQQHHATFADRYAGFPVTVAPLSRFQSDAEVKEILEKDGLAKVMPWTNDLVGAYTVHPLSSVRMGDDPATSALDDTNELRGHPGIFVTDGSAVLVLGDIGPGAAMPVMEGKAALFKRFANIDAWPIALDTQDVDEIVRTAYEWRLSHPGGYGDRDRS